MYLQYLQSCVLASQHVLVCMMGVCQRSKRACSDILWVAIVPCVLRTVARVVCVRACARTKTKDIYGENSL